MKATILLSVLVSSLALTACNQNKGSGNGSNASSANSSGTANASGTGQAGGAGGDFRTAAAAQCEERVRANPNVPAGFDVSGACTCAVESAYSGRGDDLETYARSDEGQRAFAQSTAQCIRQRLEGAGAAPANEAAAEEAEEPAQ